MFRPIIVSAVVVVLALLTVVQTSRAEDQEPRLYTLDCGKIKVLDANIMDDTDSYAGPLELVASCYVIQHGNDYMLWDAGFNLEAIKGVKDTDMFQPKIEKTIEQAIAVIGLKPSDIKKIGISHNHFDHIGQANVFKDAELLIGAADYDMLFAPDAKPDADLHPEFLSEWADGQNVQKLTGDHDVYGDGSVVILSMPGHTPGHQALMVKLKNVGTVVLSGDLYHFKENYKHGRISDLNTSREQTLASFKRMDEILRENSAQLVIQHDPEHFARMKQPPEYLE
ncbi:MAG TPA: MBL fold metallo-hydrolase [Rhodospirillaceae bacterium]|nr:MBL fold metallo-hydrolase [Rhodospirillaceae bacterium]